jgi:hypothetical protein
MVGQYSTRNMEYDSNATITTTITTTTTEGRGDDNVVSYQIDCQTTKKGKMIAGTKRRICWKFGFSDRDSVRRGLSGTDCRGEEHEVVFVWSLTSGKKFVLADGHEVHWSKQSPITEKFESGWECSWYSEMADKKRLLRVVASSSPLFEKKKTNKNSSVADSSFCNFDLLIDGVSFSKLTQMFELGLNKTIEDKRRISLGGIDALLGNNMTQQQQQQPQRRKHIYDNESDAVSHYSHHSSQPDLLYSHNSHHSSQPDLMHFHEQPHRQQQEQHVPLAACNELMSQSMPDMRYDFSMSHNYVLGGEGGSVPQLNYNCTQQHQHQLQQSNECSPTSVSQMTTANPFDVYASTSFKPQQQQQQQTHAQYNSNNYVPRPKQHQQSTVY